MPRAAHRQVAEVHQHKSQDQDPSRQHEGRRTGAILMQATPMRAATAPSPQPQSQSRRDVQQQRNRQSNSQRPQHALFGKQRVTNLTQPRRIVVESVSPRVNLQIAEQMHRHKSDKEHPVTAITCLSTKFEGPRRRVPAGTSTVVVVMVQSN